MTVILDCAFLRNFQGLETHIRRYTITRMLEMHNQSRKKCISQNKFTQEIYIWLSDGLLMLGYSVYFMGMQGTFYCAIFQQRSLLLQSEKISPDKSGYRVARCVNGISEISNNIFWRDIFYPQLTFIAGCVK